MIVPMLHQGGFERVCVETARILGNDLDITILLFSDRDINYDISGINVVNINIPSEDGALHKVFNALRRVYKVRRYKKTQNIDYCYSFGSSANIVNVLSGFCGKTKVIVGLRSSLDMRKKSLIKLYIRFSDVIIACSKEIKSGLEKEYGYYKAVLIYNPVDIDKLTALSNEAGSGAPYFPEEKGIKKLVMLGREDWIKGYWHLIKAISVLVKKLPEVRLVIAGAGDFSKYMELAENLGVENHINFTGLLLNPFPCVKEADLYVLSSNIEGHPNALIEAMALGKPCIATDCRTGPREVILSDNEYQALYSEHPYESTQKTIYGEYGVLIKDMSCNVDLRPVVTEEDENLAREIERFICDPKLLKYYGKKSLEKAKQLSPQQYKEELLEVFMSLDQ